MDGSVALGNAIHRLPHTGLDFLPAGAAARRDDALDPQYPAYLADMIAAVKGSYDYVFIDLPPHGPLPRGKDAGPQP